MRRRILIYSIIMSLVMLLPGCAEQNGRQENGTADVGNWKASEVLSSDLQKPAPESIDTETQRSEEKGGELVDIVNIAVQDSETDGGGTVTVIMVGDILLHTPVENSALREDGSYDFSAVFAPMKDEIAAADLALVNQEVIIGGKELGISGYPAFNAPYELGDALADTGFDVVCHATNHAMDKGKKGIQNCLAFWEKNYPDIKVIGIYGSQSSQDEIYIYEKEGIRIAVLNYTYGLNGIALPSDMPFAVNLLDEDKVVADLQRAEAEADFTIVCPHWGTEYLLRSDSMQEKWKKIFLENGADLVIGTHPHVIEPVEYLKEEETGREMLVYESLGNFVNWTSGTGAGVANRMVGGMAQVTIARDADGEVGISDYGVRALVCHVQPGTDGVTVYSLSDYTDALAEKNAIKKQAPDFSKAYCEELCNQIWGELWE